MGTETLGLKVTADTSDLEAGFTQAQTSVNALGGSVKKVGDEFDKLITKWQTSAASIGGMLDGTTTKAAGFAAVLDNVGKKVEEVAKKQSIWTKDINLGKLATTFNEVTEATQKLVDTMQGAVELAHFSAEMRNLEANVPVERLKMMQEATENAVQKIDLMKFSMRALAGESHVTEAGLDVVLKAANTLGDQGFGDTMENAEKLMHALRSGSAKELKDFGISLDETKDKGTLVNEMLEKFRSLADMDVNVDPNLKKIEIFQTAWKDSIVEIKQTVGGFIEWFGDAVGTITDLLAPIRKPDVGAAIGAVTGQMQTDVYRMSGSGSMMSQAARNRRGMVPMDPDRQQGFDWNWGPNLYVGAQNGNVPKPKTGGGGGKAPWNLNLGQVGAGVDWQPTDFWGRSQDDINAQNNAGAAGDFFGGAASGFGSTRERSSGLFGTAFAGIEEQQAKMADFTAKLQDQHTLIGAGYATLTAGIGAAVDAAITGNESIGKAFAKATAIALKSIAIESTARAVFEGAMALGSLAIYDSAGAAKHGLAAAQYAAAAVVAGVGAAALGSASGAFSPGGGGGGPSTPAGGTSGAGIVNTTSGNGGAQVINVYVTGAVTANDTQKLGEVLSKAIGSGQQAGRVRSSDSVVVHYE